MKSDDQSILTYIIDYSDNKIIVTGLLHEKKNGTWIQKISYEKLRVRSDYVINKAEIIGFTLNENKNIYRMFLFNIEEMIVNIIKRATMVISNYLFSTTSENPL